MLCVIDCHFIKLFSCPKMYFILFYWRRSEKEILIMNDEQFAQFLSTQQTQQQQVIEILKLLLPCCYQQLHLITHRQTL